MVYVAPRFAIGFFIYMHNLCSELRNHREETEYTFSWVNLIFKNLKSESFIIKRSSHSIRNKLFLISHSKGPINISILRLDSFQINFLSNFMCVYSPARRWRGYTQQKVSVLPMKSVKNILTRSTTSEIHPKTETFDSASLLQSCKLNREQAFISDESPRISACCPLCQIWMTGDET